MGSFYLYGFNISIKTNNKITQTSPSSHIIPLLFYLLSDTIQMIAKLQGKKSTFGLSFDDDKQN